MGGYSTPAGERPKLFTFTHPVYKDEAFYSKLHGRGLIFRYAGTVFTGAVFIGSNCFRNYMIKRPVWAGIQKHIAMGAAGVLLGEICMRYYMRRRAEHDAVLLHYVSLHPEDFQEPPKKTYNDVLMPWKPIR